MWDIAVDRALYVTSSDSKDFQSWNFETTGIWKLLEFGNYCSVTLWLVFRCIIPFVFYAHKGGGSYVKTQLSLYLFLLGRRHVSATVGHPQVTEMYNEEKLYIVRSLVAVHIVNFQRDLVVVRFICLELIICSTSKVDRLKVRIHVVRHVL